MKGALIMNDRKNAEPLSATKQKLFLDTIGSLVAGEKLAVFQKRNHFAYCAAGTEIVA